MENKLPVRKSLRLSGYDYNTRGAYFITFCTYNRQHTLSHIVGAIHESPESRLTSYGEIVDTIIKHIPTHLHVTIDQYVIMPNHVHLIAVIHEKDVVQTTHEWPSQNRSIISKTVGYIKMNASKAIRQLNGNIDVWQRGYHDHVIRNREDYIIISQYIAENPVRWHSDKLYSAE